MSLRKYIQAACALCGSTIKGRGWFCSYRCDEREYANRAATSKALFEAGRPVRRK